MFAKIHTNLRRKDIATIVPKNTFHRWMNGDIPLFSTLSKCDELLGTHTTIEYVNKFNKTAQALSSTLELNKISDILKISGLAKEDRDLLGDIHKKRVWRKTSLIIDSSELLDEY